MRIVAAKTVILFLSLTFLLSGPALSLGASTNLSMDSREAMLIQIKNLLTEVLRLQTLLEKQKRIESRESFSASPHNLVFFPLTFESIYFIQGDKLISSRSDRAVRVVDQELFNLFKNVFGAERNRFNLSEWRVYYDEDTDLDAFVELDAKSREWVVGVNRAGFESGDKANNFDFANLFIHEYAHLWHFDDPDILLSYEDKFWSTTDRRHQKKVELADEADKFFLMSDYYNLNNDRFVSDYATQNVEEDFAETFVTFVLEDKPLGLNEKERKVLYFFNDSEMIKVRTLIRSNLKELGFEVN